MIRSTVCITEYQGNIISWLDVDSKMERLSVDKPNEDITGNEEKVSVSYKECSLFPSVLIRPCPA